MDEDKVNINMNKVCRDIFRAVHEGKWLRIEYENKEGIFSFISAFRSFNLLMCNIE